MSACGSKRDDIQTKFSPTNPHFFKIILEETLRNNDLKIPNKFVRIYGATLSHRVFLKLPCGLRWEFGLKKSNGKVWIDKGWTDFSKYYSLGRGDLLVFRYEGDSQFHVLIFDTSTTEIDYPSNNPDHLEKHDDTQRQPRHERFVEKGTEDDDSVEILESSSPFPKTREKSMSPCPRPLKRMRTNVPVVKTRSYQSERRPNFKFATKDGGGEKSLPPSRRKRRGDVRKIPLNRKEKAQALKSASEFKSKDPFFIATMQRSYVGAKGYLNIPSFFIKKYLKRKHADVILKAPGGRTWSVKYTFRVQGKHARGKFLTNWKTFVWDNNLKIGDVCVFVLTKSIDVLFEVVIFRENGKTNSTILPVHKAATSKVRPRASLSNKLEDGDTMSKKTENEIFAPGNCIKRSTTNKKVSALERASSFQLENPFFTVTLGAAYTEIRSSFTIPSKFAKTYINKTEGEAILEGSDGRCWFVQYKVRDRLHGSSQVAEFRHGWSAFSRDNNLEKGDTCTFELTNGNDISFNVSIVKANGCPLLAAEKATKPIQLRSNEGVEFKSGFTSSRKTSMFSMKIPIAEEEQEGLQLNQQAGMKQRYE